MKAYVAEVRGKKIGKRYDRIMDLSPGGTYDDAIEYYEFKQLGDWHGERTPGFLVRLCEPFKPPVVN